MVTTKDDLKLLTKIEQIKKEFREQGVTKSGTGYHYKFFELKDIVPRLQDLNMEYNIATQFHFNKHSSKLIVIDLDSGSTITFNSPNPTNPNNNDPKKQMQDIGSIQTYQRRYLYLQLLDIVEADPIDNQQPNPNNKPHNKPKYSNHTAGFTTLAEKQDTEPKVGKDAQHILIELLQEFVKNNNNKPSGVEYRKAYTTYKQNKHIPSTTHNDIERWITYKEHKDSKKTRGEPV